MLSEKCLFVVSGPAGTGKDTVVDFVCREHSNIEKTVSATTRAPRGKEQEGVDYHFCTVPEFEALIADGGVVEYNCYCGNYYGTPRSEIGPRLAADKVPVLVIDVNGAANIKRMYPEATTVFLCPPSIEELERRLRGRGTDSEESIQKRMATAIEELKLAPTYDERLTNVTIEQCAADLYALIRDRMSR